MNTLQGEIPTGVEPMIAGPAILSLWLLAGCSFSTTESANMRTKPHSFLQNK
ncbi:hypothetical protein [Ruminococcus sp.]|uniref:hypothetical protein n=1 Tax=Ruminococcus sp. TaxID=41978 RepID=UPI0025E61668|nr:hypothetical protein [Ruminococcus sp.]MBQ8967135.1 hypothetical protein [Ruminococcus sp.]